jgi:hypothetical protein
MFCCPSIPPPPHRLPWPLTLPPGPSPSAPPLPPSSLPSPRSGIGLQGRSLLAP